MRVTVIASEPLRYFVGEDNVALPLGEYEISRSPYAPNGDPRLHVYRCEDGWVKFRPVGADQSYYCRLRDEDMTALESAGAFA